MAGRAGLDHVQEIVLDGFVSHAILLAGGNGTADLQGATATETGLVLAVCPRSPGHASGLKADRQRQLQMRGRGREPPPSSNKLDEFPLPPTQLIGGHREQPAPGCASPLRYRSISCCRGERPRRS